MRFPASWCGLAGIRPIWGRVSRYGVMPGVRSMDTVGPLGRTVEECALTLAAIAGHDPKDRTSSQEPVPDYRNAPTGDVKGLKIGIVKELLYTNLVEEEIRQSVLTAANTLREMGAQIEELSVPLAATGGHWRPTPGPFPGQSEWRPRSPIASCCAIGPKTLPTTTASATWSAASCPRCITTRPCNLGLCSVTRC
ncbi:MAG: hypothetical protein HQ475_14825 [SAR202 cluster bacterium]|nr:hypothetical protein [SAR202 cluster bacterium]